MIRAALIGFALGLAVAATSSWWAYGQGQAVCQTAQARAVAAAQAKQFAAAELASRNEAARLAAVQLANDLARDLEDQANADPTAGCGLSAGRVRRLNRYAAP